MSGGVNLSPLRSTITVLCNGPNSAGVCDNAYDVEDPSDLIVCVFTCEYVCSPASPSNNVICTVDPFAGAVSKVTSVDALSSPSDNVTVVTTPFTVAKAVLLKLIVLSASVNGTGKLNTVLDPFPVKSRLMLILLPLMLKLCIVINLPAAGADVNTTVLFAPIE